MEYNERKNIPGVWGVRLENIVDLDIDNPMMQKFWATSYAVQSLEENQIH